MKGKLLIIDDDPDILFTARMLLKQHFTVVRTVSDPSLIYDHLERDTYDVILLDMNFTIGATSGREGMHWLQEIRKLAPETQVVMSTAYGDIELAVASMKEGATDFVVKPWEHEKLVATLQTVYRLGESQRRLETLESKQKVLTQDIDREFSEILSESACMEQVFSTIEKVAATDANVLILGENGTGKELVARAIHRNSPRVEEAFIKLDLGAVAESLFEAELFGHTKGAFTDAREERKGRFEVAEGGTLFLDEIGNLSLPLQAKLLTALQARAITPVGGNKPIEVDIRLVCATNAPLYEMVQQQQFRQDLLYRINTVEIKLPPLRERKEDIPLLARHFLEQYVRKYNKPDKKLSREALKKLQQYPWPGNIRELQHAIERSVILAERLTLQPEDFVLTSAPTPEREAAEPDSYNIEQIEKQAIIKAIQKHDGNLSQAARELGMGRTTLYRKMEKYGI